MGKGQAPEPKCTKSAEDPKPDEGFDARDLLKMY